VRIRAEVPLATAALPIRALPQAARIGVDLRDAEFRRPFLLRRS
jgi:hypothetical protein